MHIHFYTCLVIYTHIYVRASQNMESGRERGRERERERDRETDRERERAGAGAGTGARARATGGDMTSGIPFQTGILPSDLHETRER